MCNCKLMAWKKGWNKTPKLLFIGLIQELLNNVIKHADAKNVLIQLVREDDRFNLTVEDDGKGFDIKETKINQAQALQILKHVQNILNGNVDIVSKKGEGTSVNIEGKVVD